MSSFLQVQHLRKSFSPTKAVGASSCDVREGGDLLPPGNERSREEHIDPHDCLHVGQ